MRKSAEAEGFEPPDLSVCGFQNRRLRPLGHTSKTLQAMRLALTVRVVNPKQTTASGVACSARLELRWRIGWKREFVLVAACGHVVKVLGSGLLEPQLFSKCCA